MTVGFVGAGRIGEPMVERLLAAGHQVHVYARRADVLERLVAAGAKPVDEVRELATCDVVVSCLYSDAQVLEVLPAIVAELDGLLISHTTGRPGTLQRLGHAAIVEAPFSGTADAVRAGRLTVYLAGEPEQVATARWIISSYAGPVVATGGRGTAMRVKLINNLLLAAITQATLRGLAAGRAMGIDESVLLEALAVSSGGSTAARQMDARGGSENYLAAITPFLRKDLVACRDAAAEVGVDLSDLLAAAYDGPMNLGV
ncbi:NAD(P)-dependent oxidoreductase [Fodinicola acaciae]|uniref:NAD(P)-dependent oxidoreductase n=1 Tax=Fodinicola acaciae TaxID=2681555 RepID=UPI001FEAFA13|nr:NAD(P)-binding domain-containing protein [Fodinicola acaciae]